jgi:hypothetical protein
MVSMIQKPIHTAGLHVHGPQESLTHPNHAFWLISSHTLPTERQKSLYAWLALHIPRDIILQLCQTLATLFKVRTAQGVLNMLE